MAGAPRGLLRQPAENEMSAFMFRHLFGKLRQLTVEECQFKRAFHALKSNRYIITAVEQLNLYSCVISKTGLHDSSRCMAGHSKWQNIKHTKQSKDAVRANLFTKLSQHIKLAVTGKKSHNLKIKKVNILNISTSLPKP